MPNAHLPHIWVRRFAKTSYTAGTLCEMPPKLVTPIRANKNYRLKNWKEANRKIKNIIPFGYKLIPSLWHFEDKLWKLNTLLKRDHIMKHLLHKYILRDSTNQLLS